MIALSLALLTVAVFLVPLLVLSGACLVLGPFAYKNEIKKYYGLDSKK